MEGHPDHQALFQLCDTDTEREEALGLATLFGPGGNLSLARGILTIETNAEVSGTTMGGIEARTEQT
jgi:hypothetical protein